MEIAQDFVNTGFGLSFYGCSVDGVKDDIRAKEG